MSKRSPRPVHALHSMAIFCLVGPPVGMLSFFHFHRAITSLTDLAVLVSSLALMVSYGGIVPAAVAGVLYGAVSILVVLLVPSIVVGWHLGLPVGALSGALATLPFAMPTSSIRVGDDFFVVCTLAGAACGVFSGLLFPVGRNTDVAK